MIEYIYKGTNNFYYADSVVAVPDDIIKIDGNFVINVTRGNKFYTMPEDSLCKLLAECFLLGEAKEEVKVSTDADRFENITKGMNEIFKKKNHDYGNSFEQSLDEEGLAASRIRMGDKWNRFKSLSKGIKAQVNDESLRDTLLDMANYAIMTVMWLDKNGQRD